MYTLKEMFNPSRAKLAIALGAALLHVAALFYIPAFGFSRALAVFDSSQLATIFAINLALNACAYYLFFSALIGIRESLIKPVSYRTLSTALLLAVVFNPFSFYLVGKSLAPDANAPSSASDQSVVQCGLEVVSFADFSQAIDAGMNVGDIVTGVDKITITGIDDVVSNTKAKRPGDLTRLITRRGIFRVSVVSDPQTGGPVLGIEFKAAACNVGDDGTPAATVEEYVNDDYGFTFALPESWTNYSIVTDRWQGYAQGEQGQIPVAEGPLLSIRHPQWTAENPRQDIPIMIFKLDQWDQMQRDVLHVGAAPVNPGELERNDTYVFALPARYNYAFLAGYEEVEQILAGNPLRTFNINEK